MGVCFTQHCIIGVELTNDNCMVVDSPDVFEERPVYNTRTGKIAKIESVLVKERCYHFSFLGKDYDEDNYPYLGTVANEIAKEKGLEVVEGNNRYVIGKRLAEYEDYGNVDLLVGSSSLYAMEKLFREVESKLPDCKVEIYFINSVG